MSNWEEGINLGLRLVGEVPDGEEENLVGPLRTFWAVYISDADICNGGFAQFYWNDTGDFAQELPAQLAKVGLPDFAELVTRANAVFRHAPDRRICQRRMQMSDQGIEELGENSPWDAIESVWYANHDSLFEALGDFASKHLNGPGGRD